jgi:hypothetical protein
MPVCATTGYVCNGKSIAYNYGGASSIGANIVVGFIYIYRFIGMPHYHRVILHAMYKIIYKGCFFLFTKVVTSFLFS